MESALCELMVATSKDKRDEALAVSIVKQYPGVIKHRFTTESGSTNSTFLLRSALHGLPLCVKALLEYGADVNETADNGATALTNAAFADYPEQREIVFYLLDHGANPHAVMRGNAFGCTALINAACGKNAEVAEAIVERLLKAHVHTNHATMPHHRTALHNAVSKQNKGVVKQLLNAGTYSNCQDLEGHTPLMVAAFLGATDILSLLLEKKALIEISDHQGFRALELAILKEHHYASQLLIEAGSDVNHVSFNGWTPLALAAAYKWPDVVRMLLEKGAKKDIVDSFNCIALHYACGNPPVRVRAPEMFDLLSVNQAMRP